MPWMIAQMIEWLAGRPSLKNAPVPLTAREGYPFAMYWFVSSSLIARA